MCRAMEEMREETILENSIEIAKNFLASGISPEVVANNVKLPLNKVKKLQQEITVNV